MHICAEAKHPHSILKHIFNFALCIKWRLHEILFSNFLTLFTSTVFAAVANGGIDFKEKIENNSLILKAKDIEIKITADCKAMSKKYGEGNWSWSNGGFMIIFKNKKYIFGRQETGLTGVDKCMD